MKQPPGGMTSCVPMVRLLGACSGATTAAEDGNRKGRCGAAEHAPASAGGLQQMPRPLVKDVGNRTCGPALMVCAEVCTSASGRAHSTRGAWEPRGGILVRTRDSQRRRGVALRQPRSYIYK
jgi:hypothetical protein